MFKVTSVTNNGTVITNLRNRKEKVEMKEGQLLKAPYGFDVPFIRGSIGPALDSIVSLDASGAVECEEIDSPLYRNCMEVFEQISLVQEDIYRWDGKTYTKMGVTAASVLASVMNDTVGESWSSASIESVMKLLRSYGVGNRVEGVGLIKLNIIVTVLFNYQTAAFVCELARQGIKFDVELYDDSEHCITIMYNGVHVFDVMKQLYDLHDKMDEAGEDDEDMQDEEVSGVSEEIEASESGDVDLDNLSAADLAALEELAGDAEVPDDEVPDDMK